MTADNEAPEPDANEEVEAQDAEAELVAPPQRADVDDAPVGGPEPAGYRPPKHIVRGIVLALVLQVIIPLTYYARADRYDERFAWRMFSGVRMQRCQTAAYEERATGRSELDLNRLVHVAWKGLFGRNRRAAIAGFLEQRCALDGVTRVEIINTCNSADTRERVPPQRYRLECGADIAWPETEHAE